MLRGRRLMRLTEEDKTREQIVETGRRLYMKDFVAANDGNISVKLTENELLITPAGVSKGFMSPEQIVKIDMSGRVISGISKPTSEMKMHLAVYRIREDVNAVVHAHPPAVTGFAAAGKALDKIILPEVILSLGSRIELCEYATPTTDEVPGAVSKKIGTSNALILSNHGALTVGSELMQAHYRMETLEAVAKITFYAKMLGNENALTDRQIKKLYNISKMPQPD